LRIIGARKAAFIVLIEFAPPDPALFVLAQDGIPVAFAGGHGQSLSWIR